MLYIQTARDWTVEESSRLSALHRDLLKKRIAKRAMRLRRRYNNLSLSCKVQQMQFDRIVKKMREEGQPKKLVLLNLE